MHTCRCEIYLSIILQKGNTWRISLEHGGKTTTFEVSPGISEEALFRLLAEKSGIAESSMIVYQFEEGIVASWGTKWAQVDVDAVEPEDGAMFRVKESAGAPKGSVSEVRTS